ncbi:hypothetical protein ACFL52_05345, partial [Candidatus Margulisiibacteriota bacterium]
AFFISFVFINSGHTLSLYSNDKQWKEIIDKEREKIRKSHYLYLESGEAILFPNKFESENKMDLKFTYAGLLAGVAINYSLAPIKSLGEIILSPFIYIPGGIAGALFGNFFDRQIYNDIGTAWITDKSTLQHKNSIYLLDNKNTYKNRHNSRTTGSIAKGEFRRILKKAKNGSYLYKVKIEDRAIFYESKN